MRSYSQMCSAWLSLVRIDSISLNWACIGTSVLFQFGCVERFCACPVRSKFPSKKSKSSQAEEFLECQAR